MVLISAGIKSNGFETHLRPYMWHSSFDDFVMPSGNPVLYSFSIKQGVDGTSSPLKITGSNSENPTPEDNWNAAYILPTTLAS